MFGKKPELNYTFWNEIDIEISLSDYFFPCWEYFLKISDTNFSLFWKSIDFLLLSPAFFPGNMPIIQFTYQYFLWFDSEWKFLFHQIRSWNVWKWQDLEFVSQDFLLLCLKFKYSHIFCVRSHIFIVLSFCLFISVD